MKNETIGEPVWTGALPKMKEWMGSDEDQVILVHPLEGEDVVGALRRLLTPLGMGTVTVVSGPRAGQVVDMFALLAGITVVETTLVPVGALKVVPASAVRAPVIGGTLTV